MWFIYALTASITWGLVYTIDGFLFKHLSVPVVMASRFLVLACACVIWALLAGDIGKDITLLKSNPSLRWYYLLNVCALLAAEALIAFSIASKNATLASLVEISYPLFIVFFSYMLFSEFALTAATAVGGALIMLGISIIYWYGG